MVKNIPNKYNQQELLCEFKEYNMKYDFFYLPIDFNSGANVGYAFINFFHPLFIIDFFNDFMSRDWSKFKSKKKCDIKYANIQGKEKSIDHFRGSGVLNQDVSS